MHPPRQALFAFDGEFSVVAPDRDVRARDRMVSEAVASMRDELEQRTGFRFECVFCFAC